MTEPARSGGGQAPAGGASRARLWRRLGLRARVTVLFGLGALLLSLAMGGLSYFTARHFLLSERTNADLRQAYVNASLIRSDLHQGDANVDQVLASVDSGSRSSSVLVFEGKAFSSPLAFGVRSISPQIRTIVRGGSPAIQSYVLGGATHTVIGVPIPSVHAVYFEVFDVSDLAHTLGVLALALAAAGLITTVLGAAVGHSASGRSVRPLSGVSRAAVAIAGGDLDTRLPAATDDPDLVGLTSSFNQMVDQLQERIERDARFTSDVSHELRSPLTTLAASLEVFEAHRDELSPRGQQALNLLGDDLRRFQRMVGDLLEISRSDTGAADLALQEVELGELVERSVVAGLRALPNGAVAPQVDIEPSIRRARIEVDKRRFERIVVNLLENAANYGGGATRVAAIAAAPGPGGAPRVRIIVDDAGGGIPPDERERVFDRFYRGQASGSRGASTGTGLGLALVAEHVRLHGGSAWTEDSDQGGARMVIELPIVEEEPAW